MTFSIEFVNLSTTKSNSISFLFFTLPIYEKVYLNLTYCLIKSSKFKPFQHHLCLCHRSALRANPRYTAHPMAYLAGMLVACRW